MEKKRLDLVEKYLDKKRYISQEKGNKIVDNL